MSNEKRGKTIAELNKLRALVTSSNPDLNESEIRNAVANGITDPKQLKGIRSYVQPTVFGGNVYHDADGVVESNGTSRGR